MGCTTCAAELQCEEGPGLSWGVGALVGQEIGYSTGVLVI